MHSGRQNGRPALPSALREKTLPITPEDRWHPMPPGSVSFARNKLLQFQYRKLDFFAS